MIAAENESHSGRTRHSRGKAGQGWDCRVRIAVPRSPAILPPGRTGPFFRARQAAEYPSRIEEIPIL